MPGEILTECGSDKHTKHGYGVLYDELCKSRRDAKHVLELGVLNGDSIRAWRLIFPQAEIVAADKDATMAASVASIEGVQFVQLDVGDEQALKSFASSHQDRFDLIVDDSSHEPAHQLAIRQHLWSALADGGAMVIEDIKDDDTFTALEIEGGRGWDFRKQSGEFDSRCVTYERRILPAVAKSRPRLVFASHDMSLSGAPIILANLLPYLRGYDVSVYSPKDGPLSSRFKAGGVRRASSVLGADLVVANTLASSAAVRAAKEAGIPCVWMIHESDPAMCGNLGAVRELIDYPKLLVFPCRATADAFSSLRSSGVRIVPSIIPPVPLVEREASPGPFLIVTFGYDEPRKGQADIREAIRGMEGVEFVAVADDPDPTRWLRRADLYVCSSRTEAFPLSLQEAKAHGVPVVSTRVFGCKEIIREGKDGLLYEPGDVAGLRAAIQRIRTDLVLREGLSRQLTHLPTFAESVALYEAVFNEALGLPTEQPIHVVYHVAGMGKWWKGIVTEQLGQLREAGLRHILATHVGEGADWLIDEAARHGLDLILTEHQPDVRNYEVLAMRLIERLVRHGNKPVLYLHAKGVSHPPTEEHFHTWRQLMMRELVVKWRDNLALLTDHDAVGVNWWTAKGKNHFSGNMWIASADWLRRLPPFDAYRRDRYSCELWIGSAPGCRAKSLVCRDKKFWSTDRQWLLDWASHSSVENAAS